MQQNFAQMTCWIYCTTYAVYFFALAQMLTFMLKEDILLTFSESLYFFCFPTGSTD